MNIFSVVAAAIYANYISLAAAQANNTAAVAEGQPCQSGEGITFACADESTLLVCNYNMWKFLSGCPQGTVCQDSLCVNNDAVVFPVLPSAPGDLSMDSAATDSSDSSAISEDAANQEKTTSSTDTSNSSTDNSSSLDSLSEDSSDADSQNSSESDANETLDDEVSNVSTLDEYDESSTSEDDWFESIKGSANTLPITNRRLYFTAIGTFMLSALFSYGM
ncbi:hypothetical protein LPJ55_003525 [Coemansia sp. RSA 990]|nr:hypothetical protein LPJ55_003525 [Coemansia sp. RSA 990]